MAWPTTSEVVSAAARELGLVSGDIANPFASADANVLQMTSLLNSLGRTLARRHQWSQLYKEHTLSLVPTSGSYDGLTEYRLPSDFVRPVDGTGWNTSSDTPLASPSPQQWQAIQVTSTTTGQTLLARLYGKKLKFGVVPTAADSVIFEYVSSWWVRSMTVPLVIWTDETIYAAGAYAEATVGYNGRTLAGEPVTTMTGGAAVWTTAAGGNCTSGGPIPPVTYALPQSRLANPSSLTYNFADWSPGTGIWTYVGPSADAIPTTAAATTNAYDFLFFDFRVLVDGLKLFWRREKGLDTTTQQQDFDASLAAALGGDGFSGRLCLNQRRGPHLIGLGNVPEGDYG